MKVLIYFGSNVFPSPLFCSFA